MHWHLPFPVAYPYHLIGAALDPTERYERVLACHEALVRYCAAVQVSDYLAAGAPDPDLNRRLLELLGRDLSLGHWVELTRSVTAAQKAGRCPAFVPEMATFYFKAGAKTGFTPEATIFDSTLPAARNRKAHPNDNPDAAEKAERFRAHKALLDDLIRAVGFLANYPLYVPLGGPRPGVVTEAYVLMGPTTPPAVRDDLNIPLAPRVREQLEYETTAFLGHPSDPSRQLLLCPLSLFAGRGGVQDVFLFNGCDLRSHGVHHIDYRAVQVSLKPLRIAPGSGHEGIVDQFRQLVEVLGGATPLAPPAAPSSAPLYFSAQREVIRERAAGFVGRGAVVAALDAFVAANPRGYFVLRGGPGQGKTAFACRLIHDRSLTHHLIAPTGGRAVPHLILGSLVAQLAASTSAVVECPAGLQERTKLFEDLLVRAASDGKRVILVVDGLDELPAEAGDPPFLPTEALPAGVFVVITSRPGERLDRLLDAVSGLPTGGLELPPLELDEIAEVLRARRPGLTSPEVERIAEACQGNPLYLHAVVDELARDPRFDLSDLPPGIDGFFGRATAALRRDGNALGRDVLGLLTVARKALSARELAQATGSRQREIHDRGIAPVRQFLFEADDGFSFYHAKFRDFVLRKVLYDDELPGYHRLLALWLTRPEARDTDYRWQSLARHLFEAGDTAELLRVIDPAFLAEKLRRCGYAALEDVELLARTLLAGDDPAAVGRCVELVEGLRLAAGGDVLDEAAWAARPFRPGPAAFRTRVVEPTIPPVPGVDLYIGMLPKIEVGADFFEVLPVGGRVVLALGDAPGAGLKPAFVARFLGNLIRRHVERDGGRDLAAVVATANRAIAGADFFDPVAVQLAELDVRAGRIRLVNAGLPFPVVYSARRGRADALPLYGEQIQPHPLGDTAPKWEQRQVEVEPGDVFVMVTDGLTEAWRPRRDAYHYGFTRLLDGTRRTAREIGEAILDDWRSHPRDRDYSDDTTVVVAVFDC